MAPHPHQDTLTTGPDHWGGGAAVENDRLDDLREGGEAGEPEIVREPDGSWVVDGAAAVEDLTAALDVDLREDEERRDYRTVAGLVLTRLGHLPTVGEPVDVGDLLHLQVAEMVGRRIAQVRVSAAPEDRDGP